MEHALRLFAALVFAATCLSSLARAGDPNVVDPSVPEKYRAEVLRAQQMGRLIFLQDRAAWIATDALEAKNVFKKDKRLRGWIVGESVEPTVVMFIGEAKGNLVELYEVSVDQRGSAKSGLEKFAEGRPLTDFQIHTFKARQLAIEADFQRCSKNYNAVVLPYEDDGKEPGGFFVYLLAATTKPNEIVLGGHVRVKVSADGEKILETKPLSYSCLSLTIAPPRGSKLAVVAVTHLISETPIETHVFLSLQHRVPLDVITKNKLVWGVVDGMISVVDKIP